MTVRPFNVSKLYRYLRWLVSASLIAALFWWVDLTSVGEALVGARPLLVVLALALAVNHRILMSVRWKLMLGPGAATVRTTTLIRIGFVSSFFTNFLPSTLSTDALRAYFLRKDNVRMSAAISSVVLDRAVGFGVLVLVSVVSGSVAYLQGFVPATWLLVLLVAVAAMIIATCLVASHPYRALAVRLRASSWKITREIGKTMATIRRYPWTGRRLVGVITYASFVYVVHIFVAYVIFRAINGELYIGYFFLFLPVAELLKWVPVSVAGLGLQEGAWVWLLGQTGIGAGEALLFALALRVISHILSSLPGALLYAWYSPRVTAGHQQPGEAMSS